MRDFHAIAVYHASLAMWAYGMITGPAMWLQQQRQQYQSQTNLDGDFVVRPTPPYTRKQRAPSFSNPQNKILDLTESKESSELSRWISLGVGNPAIRLSSFSPSSAWDSLSVPSSSSRRLFMTMTALGSENSEEGPSVASVQNPEAVMKLARNILLGRSVDTQTQVMDEISPLVKKCYYFNERDRRCCSSSNGYLKGV
jgi:hypothetical protein